MNKPHSSIQQVAEEVLAIQAHYAERGLSMAQVALAGADDFIEFRHYPKNDLVDLGSGYEMYFHAHSFNQKKNDLSFECGHFHLFKRDQAAPLKFTHLIAISLNQQGLPVKLFTTNGWVTGEVMKDAKQLKPLLANFQIQVKGRMAPLARWVSGLVHIFQSEIQDLLTVRDQQIQKMVTKSNSRTQVLEDQSCHVLSETHINLLKKLESLVA